METPIVFPERAFAPVEKVLAPFGAVTGYTSGRGSPGGWSKWSTLQQCPYRYYLRYVQREPAESSINLEIGSYVHAFLAGHYGKGWDLARLEALRDEWLAARGNPEALQMAWRCIEAYLAHYEQDYLFPLAVELTAEDTTGRHTCRYDLVARIDDPPETVSPGVYVVEHKTAGVFSDTTLDGWDLDGEILGQIAIWNHAGLSTRFGPLRGLIVNILGKQKLIKFHRTFVDPGSLPWREHRKTIAWCQRLRDDCARTRRWPRFFSNCIGRYGRCDYYFRCSGLRDGEVGAGSATCE